MNPRNPHAGRGYSIPLGYGRHQLGAMEAAAVEAERVAARDVVIAQQDRHLERYHRHLAAVYRVARLACLLIGGGLLFGVARDVAQGVDPWMPTLRLAGASWCLVTWRWTRSDEQAWRAGR